MTKEQSARMRQDHLRELPSVDGLLQAPGTEALKTRYGRVLTVEALRNALSVTRTAILSGVGSSTEAMAIIEEAKEWLETLLSPSLKPVINATGIIVHTNLGRAPLSEAAISAVQGVAHSYSTLEFDLQSGERGSRAVHAEQLLTRLTGAESALVVNNNAAAVMLMLAALCRDKEVIISRGQLVEIGGGFRIPDVMVQSGAKLVEVGTTNRTHLRDYENAIGEDTAAILVAHHSNFRIIGFTTEPSLSDLAKLAHGHGIALLFDQGSGALLDVTPYGLEREPMVQGGLQAGCDVVAFSGDKLLGGPQAGILCGRSAIVAQMKRHPLARAVRADKMCLSALSATLLSYLRSAVDDEIPVWRMIARPLDAIRDDANQWAAHLEAHGIPASVIEGHSKVGGGSLPGTSLPTALLALGDTNVEQLARTLRAHDPPIIGRVQADRLLLDPRTVLPQQRDPLLAALVKNHANRPVE